MKFLEGMTVQDLPDNVCGKRAFSSVWLQSESAIQELWEVSFKFSLLFVTMLGGAGLMGYGFPLFPF